MSITALDAKEATKERWNAFVSENFPPVGAFLQSWEWGSFKSALHGDVQRFAIADQDGWLGCFQLEIHSLPLGLSYGYMPRGPVLRKDIWENDEKVNAFLTAIRAFMKHEFPRFAFVRIEPPHKTMFSAYKNPAYKQLFHYVQPRFNQLVTLAKPEELLKTFSNDIRHDIRAAERLGVAVEIKETLTPKEQQAFEVMKNDTRNRSKHDIFPSDHYFENFLTSFGTSPHGTQPYLSYFLAYKEGEPVAIHLNVLFSHTLTYLFGASYSGPSSKRAPGYLHWKSMLYAEENGFNYYDLGGVDDRFWHGLTYFKRQFGGETYEYAGTFDVIMKPAMYWPYRLAKNCMNRLKGV